MKKSDSLQFTARIQNLFTEILTYHFKRKPSKFDRQTLFGTYASLLFRKASGSPLLQLLKQDMIGEFEAVEVLVKNEANQKIDDTDLESVIMSVRDKDDTLFILVTSGDVPSDDFDRLYRVFTRYQVIILPLGEDDISKLENFVKNGNINACLVILAALADRVSSGDEKLPDAWAHRVKRQKEAIKSRLAELGRLKTPQIRTLVKKLAFLMSFEKSGSEVSKACASVRISRKLFYLWLENDPVFRKLVHI